MLARALPLVAFSVLLATAACGSSDSPDVVGPGAPLDIVGAVTGDAKVGDLVQINVNGNDACANAVIHPGRVVAIGSRAIIVSDTLNPRNGFSTADFQRFAARFDTLVYPLGVAAFGAPTDIDRNGHVVIVFTRAVNELTERASSTYVGGFAFSRDLFPRIGTARAQPCPASNQGEYFYLLTPDPLGTINGNVRSTTFVEQATTAVLAHEFEHLINASRRLYINSATDFEDKWLDEGLAHIAEELLFYHEARLNSRRNLVAADVFSATATLAYAQDMRSNATRYRGYLAAPQRNSPYASEDSLPTRGAAWSLLRYTADRVITNPAAGSAQLVANSGSLTVSPGATAGEYSATLVNTSRVTPVAFATDTLTVSRVTAVVAGAVDAISGPTLARLAEQRDAEPPRDERFESRLRARERALAPRMGDARAWYRSAMQTSGWAPAMSRAASLSGVDDAENAFWFALVNRNAKGIANVEASIGSRGTFASFLRDWSVANAVDDVVPAGTSFSHPSWNWRSVYLADTKQPYPLRVEDLPNGATPVEVLAGGSAHYRFAVPANGTATIRLSAGASPAPFELVVVRTK